MKSQPSILLVIVLIVFSCKTSVPTKTKIYSDNGGETLNGQVREIFTRSSFSKHNSTRLTFDQQGNMLNLSISALRIDTTEGKTDSIIEKQNTNYFYHYKNDVIGSITVETRTKFGKDTTIWKFDALGRIVGNLIDATTENHSISKYKYDINGNVAEITINESAAKVTPVLTRFKYDNQNHIIQSRIYEQANILLFTQTHRYIAFDAQKNWVKAIVHYEQHPPMGHRSGADTITRKITYY